MKTSDNTLLGKKVGFFGLGKSNLAVMKLLPKNIPITLRSESPIKKEMLPRGIKPLRFYEGESAFRDFNEDLIFFSPSVRRERTELDPARKAGTKFSSDLELFLAENKSKLIAISGSDGKSTTATLTALLLEERLGQTAPIGNIGSPFCASLSKKKEISVAEISSFSLRYATPITERAAITNITENHLNWHKDFEEYKNTKLSLLKNTKNAVISADDKILFEFAKKAYLFAVTSVTKSADELKDSFSSEMYYTVEKGHICRNGKALFPISIVAKKEIHNLKNLLCAMALTDGLVSVEYTEKVAKSFCGLEHRCQTITSENGVTTVNSSIDTTPARSAQTISSLGKSLIVILGGRGKCKDYKELYEPLKKHAKLAVVTGENKNEIAKDISGATEKIICESFDDAVIYALSVAESGDTVLLSPASTSYDSFENFEKRGEKFKEIVLNFYSKKQ